MRGNIEKSRKEKLYRKNYNVRSNGGLHPAPCQLRFSE